MRSDGLWAPSWGQPQHTTPKPLRWPVFWVSVLGLLGVLDLLLNRRHDGSTLSEFTRAAFRVDTHAGRVAFLLTCTAFIRHILKPR